MAYMDLSLPGSPRRHRTCVPGILCLSIALFSTATLHAQDVAEAARQQQAKKDSQQKKSKHVYTEEDLKHPTILTPEDREQLEAKKKQNAAPAEKPADAIDAQAVPTQTTPPQVPLGDVARAYRQQKQLQHFFDAQQSAQFHLPAANAGLAAPKPPVLPALRAPANPLVIIRPAARPPIGSETSVHPTRRSPFGRPVHVPSPAIRSSLVAPPVVTPVPTPPLVEPAPATIVTSAPLAVVPNIAPKTIVPPQPLPRATVLPNSPARTIVVQRGDSLWKLAQQNLGGGLHWRELLAANPSISDPPHLEVGAKVFVPAASMSARTPSKIIVRKGDTLWTLAQTHLGRATSWTCIAQANPLVHDPQRIFAGQQLLLPANCVHPAP